jgi:asparagine N-glycosylation enzyme membrane subunit Stt3
MDKVQARKQSKTLFLRESFLMFLVRFAAKTIKTMTFQAFIVPQTHALQWSSMTSWTGESPFQTGSNGLQKHYENAILNNGARSKVPNDFDYGWWIIWQEQYVVSSHKVRGSRAIHSVKSG